MILYIMVLNGGIVRHVFWQIFAIFPHTPYAGDWHKKIFYSSRYVEMSRFAIVILFVCGAVLHAQQHIVPDQHSSIQAAIDAAAAGDTVMVRAGS